MWLKDNLYKLHLHLPYTKEGPKASLLCSHRTGSRSLGTNSPPLPLEMANKATKSYQALTKKKKKKAYFQIRTTLFSPFVRLVASPPQAMAVMMPTCLQKAAQLQDILY